MFTGIVEEMGTVIYMEERDDLVLWDKTKGKGWVLRVEAGKTLEGCTIGCSIAVNGTCLTVTSFDDTSFTFGVAPETLKRTNISDLQKGDRVNLERSAKLGDPVGGHNVQGHVDECGRILSKTKDKDSLWIKVEASWELVRLMVPKGYIACDGTSLTVVDVHLGSKDGSEPSWFSFMLIEHTQKAVVIPLRPVGGKVNLEADIVGKHIVRALDQREAAAGPASRPEAHASSQGGIHVYQVALVGFLAGAVGGVLALALAQSAGAGHGGAALARK